MVFRFRIILDTQEDVFRDLEILQDATMEDFHNAITQAFGFGGQEMASFYLSDDKWEQGEEIALFDMSEGPEPTRIMAKTLLEDVLNEDQTKMIYVYDFLSMWTFLVELAEIAEPQPGMQYPNLMYVHGELPEEAPDKEFVGESMEGDLDDDLDYEDDDFDSLDIDSWN
ncbi:IS1096 element passenger TnpR family protein [Gilvibacter sp.]|uniref:IS1096 element passenger TnpR family protein n=1 Tax=Gilvibacter sp. TaxID=2729997 RepID=UPI003B518C9D